MALRRTVTRNIAECLRRYLQPALCFLVRFARLLSFSGGGRNFAAIEKLLYHVLRRLAFFSNFDCSHSDQLAVPPKLPTATQTTSFTTANGKQRSTQAWRYTDNVALRCRRFLLLPFCALAIEIPLLPLAACFDWKSFRTRAFVKN